MFTDTNSQSQINCHIFLLYFFIYAWVQHPKSLLEMDLGYAGTSEQKFTFSQDK